MRSPFLVFIALAAALLTSRSSAAAEPLRIAYTAISLMYGPLWITREAGLFKKYGLDAELLYLSGGTMSTAALISDDVQISFTGASNVVAANLAGSDAVLHGATIDLLPFEIWAIPSIKDPAQLKGTRMGVTRFGSTTHFVARYVLKRLGIKESDITFLQAGGQPELFTALKGNSLQSAVLNTGPFTVRAQKEGFARLADVAAIGRPYIYGSVATRASFARSRPDVMSRFAKAFVEGIHRFKTDKRQALAAIEKYTKTKTTAESEQVYEIYANRYVKRTPEITAEGMQTVLEEIAESRPLPPGTTPERFVESRIFRELGDSGFVDALYRGR
jgi:NitT/TauT family transport system substrate-binding protein